MPWSRRRCTKVVMMRARSLPTDGRSPVLGLVDSLLGIVRMPVSDHGLSGVYLVKQNDAGRGWSRSQSGAMKASLTTMRSRKSTSDFSPVSSPALRPGSSLLFTRVLSQLDQEGSVPHTSVPST